MGGEGPERGEPADAPAHEPPKHDVTDSPPSEAQAAPRRAGARPERPAEIPPGEPVQAGGSEPTRSDESESPGRETSLSTLASLATLAIAVTGIFWFGLLSAGAAIAYSPAGVWPREIGLTSTTLLGQSAIGLVVMIGLGSAAQVLLALCVYVVARKIGRVSRRTFLTLSVAVTLGILAFSVGIVVQQAFEARSSIKQGRSPNAASLRLGLLIPWHGEVVALNWAQSKPADVPSPPLCALYLGQAGGTSVFYDSGLQQTWRLPSAELVVRALPTFNSCGQP